MFVKINGIVIPTATITPSAAEEMLKKNDFNRRRSSEDLNNIINKFVNGEWNEETIQVIRISGNGELLDGQGRLKAVSKLGICMKNCLVIEGESLKAIEEIDTGCPRSIRQRFETSPRFDKADLPHIKWLGMLLNLPVNKFSTERAFNLFQEHAETCRMISKMRGSRIYNKNLRPNIIWATIGRAYEFAPNEKCKQRIVHFAECLHHGEVYSKEDRAAIVLRDYLSAVEGKKTKENRSVSVAGGLGGQDFLRNCVINALYRFEKKECIQRLTQAPLNYLRYDHELS